MIKKSTTFIHFYIISLYGLGMLFFMPTVHATSFNSKDKVNDDIYYCDSNSTYLAIKEKLTALPQQIGKCNTLTEEEKSILQSFITQEANNDDTLQEAGDFIKLGVALVRAVADYDDYGLMLLDDYYTNDYYTKEQTFFSCLIAAKKYLAEEIGRLLSQKEEKCDKKKYDKIVNSLLQLICLQGSKAQFLTNLVVTRLNSYDQYIQEANTAIEKLPQLLKEEIGTDLLKKAIATEEKREKRAKESLKTQIAFFFGALNKGKEEELEDTIYPLKRKIKHLIKSYFAAGAEISPIIIGKIVNDFLCFLIDTQKANPKIKEIKSIQTLYIAQFRFKLLKTIIKGLETNSKLKNYLNKLNRSEKEIAIEEIITLDVAETVMELDTFIHNSSITIQEKQQIAVKALQEVKQVIMFICIEQFNKIKGLFPSVPTEEIRQQFKQQIFLLATTSLVNIKDCRNKEVKTLMQDVQKRVNETWTQKAGQLKTLFNSFAKVENKQAKIKQLLQQIHKQVKETYTQQASKVKAAPISNNVTFMSQWQPQKISDITTSIGKKTRKETTTFLDLSKQADFTAWFNKLKGNIKAQGKNPFPLLLILLMVFFSYYQTLNSLVGSTLKVGFIKLFS